MQALCCYTKLEPRSLAAMKRHAPQIEMVDVSGSLYAYNEAIAERWNGKTDLVVIEHDIEITANVLPSFASCDNYWCSYSYFVYQRKVKIGLGCVRFSVQAQQIVSVDEFLCEDDWRWYCQYCSGNGCWATLDARIAQALRSHGVNVCCHGSIDHHHEYSKKLDSYEAFESNLKYSSYLKDKLPTDLFGPSWEG